MHFYYRVLLLIAAALFLAGSMNFAYSQTEVKISDKKIVVDGKHFYQHKVKKGETIGEISKAYNVTKKDIAMENPEAIDNFKQGMLLKIPVTEDKSKFIYHTIEKGQTLYFVSKKYNIEIKEIHKHNPAIESGIHVGTVIKIPKNKGEVKSDTEKNKATTDDKKSEKKDKGTTKTHIVEKGETIYGLLKKYEINEEALFNANPGLKESGLKKGDTIIISTVITDNKKSKDSDKKTDSIIENKEKAKEKTEQKSKKESGSSTEKSTANNTPETKIKTESEEVKNNSNTTKTENKSVEQKAENKAKTEEKTEIEPANNNNEAKIIKEETINKTEPCGQFDYKSYNKPFRIALLGPFYIAHNRGYVLKSKKKDEEPPIYPKSLKFLEFYQGILIALDTLKKAGISVELHVFDTEKDSTKLIEISKSKDFENMDLIIGPFFSNSLKQFSDFSKKKNIPLVSPLSQDNTFLLNNPYAFQVNGSLKTQLTGAADYFSYSQDNNYIVINTSKKEDSLLCLHFKNKIFEFSKTKFNKEPAKFKDVVYKTVGFKGIQDLLSKDNNNVIFIPSVSETFIANIFTKLNTLEEKYPITLLGTTSWATEDNVEHDYLFNLQYTQSSTFNVNYQDTVVKIFLGNYRNTYNTEPTKYSFCGYDIALYFISALKTYGRNFANCITSDTILNSKGLQTDFQFRRVSETGGFENSKSFIIQYDKEFNINIPSGYEKK